MALCISSLEECLFRSSARFLIGLSLLFDRELHELFVYLKLEINPSPVALFANIFSHSVGCVFILFMVVFAVQKLLRLIRSHLLTFVFIFIILGGGSKKILLGFMSESVPPLFSSKSFIKTETVTDLENKLSVTQGRGVNREAGIDCTRAIHTRKTEASTGSPSQHSSDLRGANLKQRGDVRACERVTLLMDSGARQAIQSPGSQESDMAW